MKKSGRTPYALLLFALWAAVAVSPPMANLLSESGQASAIITLASYIASSLFLVFALCVFWFSIVRDKSVRFSIVYFSLILGAASAGWFIFEILYGEKPRPTEMRMALYDGREFRSHIFKVIWNPQGWRSKFDYEEEPPSENNVLLIGDSFIFGIVDQNDTIDEILVREFFRSTKQWALNLGIAGIGPLQYLESARLFRDYPAKWVFLGLYVGNDFVVGSIEYGRIRDFAKGILNRSRLLATVANSMELRRNIDNLELDDGIKRILPLDQINVLGLNLLPALDQKRLDDQESAFRQSNWIKNIILEIRRTFSRSTFCLLIFPIKQQISPYYARVTARFGYRGPPLLDTGLQDAVAEWAREQNLCFVDFTEIFRTAEGRGGDRLYYLVDDHMNASANRIVARKIAEIIGGGR